MIPLFQYQKRALANPMFYVSEYREEHRDAYYQRLQDIEAEAGAFSGDFGQTF